MSEHTSLRIAMLAASSAMIVAILLYIAAWGAIIRHKRLYGINPSEILPEDSETSSSTTESESEEASEESTEEVSTKDPEA